MKRPCHACRYWNNVGEDAVGIEWGACSANPPTLPATLEQQSAANLLFNIQAKSLTDDKALVGLHPLTPQDHSCGAFRRLSTMLEKEE